MRRDGHTLRTEGKTEKHKEKLSENKLSKVKSEVCRRLRYDPKDEHFNARNIYTQHN